MKSPYLLLLFCFSLVIYSCQKKEEFLKEGSSVPFFTLRAADGTRNWSIDDGKGSIIIINFWATWCPSCKEEMPSMQRFYKKFNGNGVRVLTVLYRDDPFQALGFLKQMNYDFPVFIDHEQRAAQIFGLTGVPETYIIGRDGRLLHRIIGPFDWDSPDFQEYINGILRS
ncbi:MAG: TlpA family protein disulfide reductase [Thermodesulfovibrionales bacterium]|nr:TlpA family protein disulfide reductase [Thermodesulfovibrionales bacterium]